MAGILLLPATSPPASSGGLGPFPRGGLRLLVLILAPALGFAQSPTPVEKPSPQAPPPITVSAVRLSAAGYMIDVRYRVVDVERAWRAFNRKQRPLMHHEPSDSTLVVPAPAYVGPLVQTSERPKPDRTYFIFFANPGRLVQAGDRVTIEIAGRSYGPFRVEGSTGTPRPRAP